MLRKIFKFMYVLVGHKKKSDMARFAPSGRHVLERPNCHPECTDVTLISRKEQNVNYI